MALPDLRIKQGILINVWTKRLNSMRIIEKRGHANSD
jgi:hypothetical protein